MATPPIVTLTGRAATGTATLGIGELVNISQFISITPTDGDFIRSYDYFDGNGASYSAVGYVAGVGYGTQGLGYHIDALAYPVSSLYIQGGSFTSNDPITIRVYDKDGYTEVQFVVRTRGPNTASTLTPTGLAVETGGSVLASSLVTVYDAEGDAPVAYRFRDKGTDGGHFSLNGVTQAANQIIEIGAANVDNLTYVGGGTRGLETLEAQVFDGQVWSDWTSWTQVTRTPGNSPPVAQISSRIILAPGQWLRASDLGITVTDDDGDLPVRYTFVDYNNSGAQFWYGGAYVQHGSSLTLPFTELSKIWVQGGGAGTTASFSVLVNDGFVWSSLVPFSVISRATNAAPVVTPARLNATVGGTVAATSLIGITDADSDPITVYRFYDSAGGGYFSLNGVTQAAGRNIDVAAADIAGLTYTGGTTAGTDTLWAQVFDGGAWSEWVKWDQRTRNAGNSLSNVSAPNRNAEFGEWVRASDLGITVTDADGDTPTQYRFTDGNNGAGSARLWFGGDYLPQGGTSTIDASRLANLWIQGGSGAATDAFSVQVYDGFAWSNAGSFNFVTRAPNRAPVATGIAGNVAVGASVAATSLISVSDADGDTPTLYRFWDPVGGGYFSLNGQAQVSGQNIDVAAAAIGNLVYVGGANAGAENLWTQIYDGAAWSEWVRFTETTIRTSNVLSAVTAPNRNLGFGEWVRASDLGITVTDADGDAPTQYHFTDGNNGAGSARLWFGGDYLAQGGSVTITADRLANLWIQGGSTAATDGFGVEVHDGFGWSNTASFNLATRAPNRAPVVTGTGTTVAIGATVAAASLISVTDADGDSPTIYRFWDPAGGGYFRLSGVTQAAGQNIDVAAASIGNLVYVGGTPAGSENLWAQVYDGAAWSEWVRFTETTVRNGNTLSTVTAPNRNLGFGEWVRASDLGIAVTDADGDAPAQYLFSDGNSGAGSARLWFGGDYLAQGGTVTLAADRLANLWIQGGSGAATDAFSVQVDDGFGWGSAASFNLVTRAPNRAPVVAGAGTTVAVGNSVVATSLITVTDADGDSPTIYRFWDPAGGGYFRLNGVTQATGQNIDVAAADIASLVYFGGANAGSENLWTQVYDGAAWSEWARFSQQTIRTTNVLSTVTVANRNVGLGEWVRASDLGITVSDADGDAPTQYRFTDGNNGAGSARLWLGGDYLAQGGTVTITADRLASLWIQGGSGAATDAFGVEVHDGFGWSNTTSFNLVSRPPNRAPVVTNTTRALHVAETLALTTLFSVSDADSDTITRYRFYDDSAQGGYFTFTGVQVGSRSTFDVNVDQLSQYTYHTGTDPQAGDSFQMRAFDGTEWSAWVTIDTRVYLPPPGQEALGTTGNDTITGLNNTLHFGGPGNDAFSNAGNTVYTAYIGGAGSDTYNVPAGNSASITFVFDADANGGSGDTLNLPGFDITNGNSGAAIIDGTTLALAVANGNRIVIIPDWQNATRGGIDSFTNGTQTWTRDQFAALLNAHPESVETATWEDLSLNSTEIRQAIDAWAARRAVVDQTMRVNRVLDSGAANFASPDGSMTYKTLSRGDDPGSTADYAAGNMILLARQGNDTLGTTSYAGTRMVVAGGSGADQYLANGNLRLVVLEDGDSTGDSLVLSVDGLRDQALIVDGRHLLIRNFASASSGAGNTTLILDWQTATNRIETFVVNTYASWNGGNLSSPASTNTYTYDQFKALIDSFALPQVTWEQLGANTTAWNQFIDQAHATGLAAAGNTAPVVTSAGASIGYRTRSTLASLFSVGDAENNTIRSYTVSAVGNERIWLEDSQTWFSSVTAVDAQYLARLRVAGDGVATSLGFQVSVFDGYDWSSTTTVTATASVDTAPTVASTNRTLNGSATAALSTFFTTSDAENDAITQYRIAVPEGGMLWYAGAAITSPVTISAANLASYSVSSDGISTSLSIAIQAYDGYAWGASTAVGATVTNPALPSLSGGFGPTGPFNAVGSVATVASIIYVPRAEAFRLDSILKFNNGASYVGFEIQSTSANAGWASGAYLSSESTILTSWTPIQYYSNQINPSVYLEPRIHTNDSETWQVRVRLPGDIWTDWTSFTVSTVPNESAYLPIDLAPADGRAVNVDATTRNYADWVGVSDSDAYNFSVGASGTLQLDFSSLDDSVTVALVKLGAAGGGNTNMTATAVTGAVNSPHASLAVVQAGGSASFNLGAGDYRLTVSAPINTPYSTPNGNTYYHLAMSYQ